MTLADLRRRLERHEANRHTGGPTKIVANYPVKDAEGRDAIRNWRQGVQDGRASVRGNVIYLMLPPMTVEEWAVRYATETEYCP
ncbi:hypothetical protein GU700_07250 [Methylobacterium sp. NI91]|nr:MULTISPECIES: hypothetical protein [unclassified Methylobacterium]QIJ74392.1 hypothetical protein CLZ_07250 [Methylobacterium sp. CLZ]QIJ79298.1 hypothetical protein GU700_07250 [Methylobacterium sp. NI91]